MMTIVAKRPWWRHKMYVSCLRALPLRERVISNKLAKLKLFFVLSTGRTGTKWLSEVLSNLHNACVTHEPVPAEAVAYLTAVRSDKLAEKYIRDIKRKDICLRLRGNCEIYGEINGNIRRHVQFIKRYLPEAKLLHLTRNGRSVIRSVMARHTFEGSHPVFGCECPVPSNTIKGNWARMSEFERACWVWKAENEFLRANLSNIARLEDIVSSYEQFSKQVLFPIELTLDKSVWNRYAEKRINASGKAFNNAEMQWSEEQEALFDSICGEEMKALGY